MSAPPHDGWPKIGDTFSHWVDLLLASQLAALRAGYTKISRYWRQDRPTELSTRCYVGPAYNRIGGCGLRLVRAEADDSADLKGGWMVKHLYVENLDVLQHSGHVGGAGTTEGFKRRPTKSPKVCLGRHYDDWKSLHLLEASLRVDARRDGRYLATYAGHQRKRSGHDDQGYFISCIVVYGDLYGSQLPEPSATIPTALEPMLSFWPSPKIKGEYMTPTRRLRKNAMRVRLDSYTSLGGRHCQGSTLCDETIGRYPIIAVNEKGEPILPVLPDAKLSAKLDDRRSSLSAALDALARARRAVLHVKTTLAAAQAMDDLDEVRRLTVEHANADEVARKKEHKVAKKRARVEKVKERIERDKDERKKGHGKKTSTALQDAKDEKAQKVKKAKKVQHLEGRLE